MFTNEKINEIARKQSAEDIGAKAEDFLQKENVFTPFALGANARKYLKSDIKANLVSYGNNIVAATTSENAKIIGEYLGKFEWYHCFETPNLHFLSERLAPLGQKVCFMAEYFLPDLNKLKPLSCDFEIRLLEKADFAHLYKSEWSNALCESRKELDVLCAGAYDGGRLVGLAGASSDCDAMWQIGEDVLPSFRGRGIAVALVSTLALEVLRRGKVPFYCCAWSNLPSARTAIKSGFVPSWAELTIKPSAVVDEMNGR